MPERPQSSGEDLVKTFAKGMLHGAALLAAVGGGMALAEVYPEEDESGTASPKPVAPPTATPQVPAVPPTPSRRETPQEYHPHPDVNLTREEIKQKVLQSLIVVEFGKNLFDSGLCTGFVSDSKSFETARHCPGITPSILSNRADIERPFVYSIHGYPTDTSPLRTFNQGNHEGVWSYYNHFDTLKVTVNSDVFRDRQALVKAAEISTSPNAKYYAVHWIGRPNTENPLNQWNWTIDEGRYIGKGPVQMDDGNIYEELTMSMPNIQKGNSGGPVVNSRGEVIGVMSGISVYNLHQVSVAPLVFKFED